MPRNNPDFHDSRNVERYYTTGELAKALSVDRKTVGRWVKSGKFGNTHQTLGGSQRPGRHRIKLSQAHIDKYLGNIN